jgi:hypothetical protein
MVFRCLRIIAIANTPIIKGISTNNENSGTVGVGEAKLAGMVIV